MALTPIQAIAVSKKYTDEEIAGGGAIKGKNCTIESIEDITGGHRVTFEWTLDDGTVQTTTMDVMDGNDGADGKGIASVAVNEESHLIITYTDGTTTDAGAIEVHSAVDSVNGKTGVVTLTASDVGALPDNTTIPSKTSDLTNDSNFIADASYVHTDNNYDNTAKGIVNGVTTALAGKISTTEKGVVNGVAELDATGRVPSAQLPSYVDDTIEGYLYDGKWYSDAQHTTEVPGETGKIYVELTTNKTYRWSGSAFVEISESLALGETSSTAYAGNKGKANADAITGIKNGNNINSFGDVESALANYTPTDSLTSLLSDKADKVTTGTPNGKLASLDSNGNLANSDVMADMSSVPATGNPLSFTTDSAQVAQNTVIAFEPIQAGSGDPSPSNVREIEGYIEANLTVPRKNLWGKGDISGTQYVIEAYKLPSGTYTISAVVTTSDTSGSYSSVRFTNSSGTLIAEAQLNRTSRSSNTVTLTEPCANVIFFASTSSSASVGHTFNYADIQIEVGSQATAYEPYNPLTAISEQLPTTLYGFKLDVESGELVVDRGIYKVSASDITFDTPSLEVITGATSLKEITSSDELQYYISSHLKSHANTAVSSMSNEFTVNNANKIIIRMPSTITTAQQATDYFTNNDVYVCGLLAQPYTYHLTPHQVKLLLGSNTVTTNGTSISLTYRKGEVAKLSDLNEIADAVNELGKIVEGKLDIAATHISIAGYNNAAFRDFIDKLREKMSVNSAGFYAINVIGWDTVMGYAHKASNGVVFLGVTRSGRLILLSYSNSSSSYKQGVYDFTMTDISE